MEIREYGPLHAEWYSYAGRMAENNDEGRFWLEAVQTHGQPVLELGSGTGRVLIPLLQAGMDLEGLENSPHMTMWCRTLAVERGVEPTIHDQDIRTFELPRRYPLIIFASGGLGLFISDADVRQAFARVRHHLEPGGCFIFEFEQDHQPVDRADMHQWTGDWVEGPDETVIVWQRRHHQEQGSGVWQQVMTFHKYVQGNWVDGEAATRFGRKFTVEEVRNLSAEAGFTGIEISSWLNSGPPRAESAVLTAICRRD